MQYFCTSLQPPFRQQIIITSLPPTNNNQITNQLVKASLAQPAPVQPSSAQLSPVLSNPAPAQSSSSKPSPVQPSPASSTPLSRANLEECSAQFDDECRLMSDAPLHGAGQPVHQQPGVAEVGDDRQGGQHVVPQRGHQRHPAQTLSQLRQVLTDGSVTLQPVER